MRTRSEAASEGFGVAVYCRCRGIASPFDDRIAKTLK